MNQKVQKYYDYTINFYKLFWHGESRGMHYGIWDKETRTLEESILNTNKYLANYLQLKGGDSVLDAGCGVGGTSFYLSNIIPGLHIKAITISKNQVAKANELKERFHNSEDIIFEQQDYTKTSFRDGFFEAVYAVESACYAPNKKDFIQEAYRLLKHNSTLVVWDGFLSDRKFNQKEQGWCAIFNKGFALDNLSKVSEFRTHLEETGFTDIHFIDMTEKSLETAYRMWRLCIFVGIPLCYIAWLFQLTPRLLLDNCLTGRIQYKMIKNDVMRLGFFVANKK